jgi:hypothetical protein
VFCRPGDDLLSQVLRHSTIGAEAFDGRVRDGIGSDRFAEGHQAGETHWKQRVVLSSFYHAYVRKTRSGFRIDACAKDVMGVDK